MQLKHVALASGTEKNADTFYADLLGLAKSEPKTLPCKLSKAIFNIDTELLMINYQNENAHFEIFITGPDKGNGRPKIEHTCLEVDNMEAFLDKCQRLNLDVARIPKGDKTLTFIKDFDGNLFEIKNP
jgi:catechol 2,3-dioxygenase-like lactoylglutathione lyase family enzyme